MKKVSPLEFLRNHKERELKKKKEEQEAKAKQ
jgi:hypothetical protein